MKKSGKHHPELKAPQPTITIIQVNGRFENNQTLHININTQRPEHSASAEPVKNIRWYQSPLLKNISNWIAVAASAIFSKGHLILTWLKHFIDVNL
jgi:hypothetical protein